MDSLKNTIMFLTKKPEAAPLLEKVFAGRTSCITNIEEAIEAIETTTKMVENAGPELKMLVEYVQEFSKIENISMSEVVRQSAKIIGLLDALIPKLSPSSSSCKPSSAEDLLSMRNLKSLLIDLSTNDDLYYTPQVRQTLTNSADILSKATTFLEKESHFTFEHFCTEDLDHNKEFIGAVSNVMGDLVELYTELGGDIAVKGIRKQQDFTKKILVSYAICKLFYVMVYNCCILQGKIDKLGDFEPVALDCGSPGVYKMVAKDMEDLAGLMDDIGLDNLCTQLELEPEDCTPF